MLLRQQTSLYWGFNMCCLILLDEFGMLPIGLSHFSDVCVKVCLGL